MPTDTLAVALYARVSSDQQVREHTIDSQLHTLRQRIAHDGFTCPEHFTFVDDGYSGSGLCRPALERLRDQAGSGVLDRLYVLTPDRLARKYAYQVLLLEELQRHRVEVVFLDHAPGASAEDDLLRQVQGMIAEYERAKILERSRRGKLQAARRGSVSVLLQAPYGYRYVDRHEGKGEAAYVVHEEEARVVQELFRWVGDEGCTIGQACTRLARAGIPSPRGKSTWSRGTLAGMLRNSTYQGKAKYGKTRVGERRQRLRPAKGQPATPKRNFTTYRTTAEEQVTIPTPALVSAEVFARVGERLQENQRRHRLGKRGASYLLQGLVVCANCARAFYGKPVTSVYKGKRSHYTYYRCTGCEPYRYGGEKLCDIRQVRCETLEKAVWADVAALLRDRDRMAEEVQRRLRPDRRVERDARRAQEQLSRTRGGLSRMLDAYESGLLDKSAFEQRAERLRARIVELERLLEQDREQAAEVSRADELLGSLERFAQRVQGELTDADWQKRREIIRCLVKRVEIDREEIRIVYRIPPQAFEEKPTPARDFLQDCNGDAHS